MDLWNLMQMEIRSLKIMGSLSRVDAMFLNVIQPGIVKEMIADFKDVTLFYFVSSFLKLTIQLIPNLSVNIPKYSPQKVS